MMQPKDVFVIMPFSSTATCDAGEWTAIYTTIFKPAIEATGYTCDRATPLTGRRQWISGSGVGSPCSRKSRSQPSSACPMCSWNMRP